MPDMFGIKLCEWTIYERVWGFVCGRVYSMFAVCSRYYANGMFRTQ